MGLFRVSVLRSSRKRRLLMFMLTAAVLLGAIPSLAQNKGGCPEIIASLLPKNGSVRGGQYTASGPMGMGGGSADLPFEHPCLKSEKFPARISVSVWYYGGEMAMMLKMQGDAADQQTLLNATSELERSGKKVRKENLAGGEIVYVDYMSECPAEGAAGLGTVDRPPIPNVKLKGVARTDNVRMEIELEGRISVDLAKAAVAEVMENLRKAEFDKVK
jgi:hypothetical protein